MGARKSRGKREEVELAVPRTCGSNASLKGVDLLSQTMGVKGWVTEGL